MSRKGIYNIYILYHTVQYPVAVAATGHTEMHDYPPPPLKLSGSVVYVGLNGKTNVTFIT